MLQRAVDHSDEKYQCEMSPCNYTGTNIINIIPWTGDEEEQEEEDWRRLHDIRLKCEGEVLEYVGRGKSDSDVGLAQARTPLSTRTHYFEIGNPVVSI